MGRIRVTEDDLLAAVNALGREKPKRPDGKGWYTVAQLAKREGVSKSAMRFRLERAVENGLQVERFVGSDYDPTGRLAKQTWLRMKK